MKKNRFTACLTAALLALSLAAFTACDSNTDDDDDIHSTLKGKTFVAADCTEKVEEYDSSASSAVTNTYSVSKIAYVVGESDALVTVYRWTYPSRTTYSSGYRKYSISGDTITFTASDGESITATISGDDSFTVDASFIDYGSSYDDITDITLAFTTGSAPDKATFTKQ